MLRRFIPKQYTTIIIFALFKICFSLDTLDETRNLTSGQTLLSSGSVFELGFFKPGTSTNWFVGIWYVVSPEIVVWVANRDHPLNNSSSTLSISKGVVVLVDPWQKIVWSSSVTNSSVANVSNPVMQLLDSGNLILKDPSRGDVLWQSFDYPSNTLLPNMKIGKNFAKGFEWVLSSWKSATDPSRGNYYYKMDTIGVPQNNLLNGAQINFRTGPWNGLRFSGVPEMETYENLFSFKVISDVNEVYYSFEAKQGASLSRVVMNETGIVQRMVWDRTSRTWSEFWYGPKDPCDNYEKCGPFGICNVNEVTICSGLEGFYPKSHEELSMRNYSGGYERKTKLSCRNKDNGFYLVKGVKLPDTHGALSDGGISIEECRNRCSMNCSCLAYSVLDIRSGSGCITWSNDLIDIRYLPGAQEINIKIAKTDLAQIGNNRRQGVLIGTMVAAAIVLLLIILPTGIIYWRKLRENKLDQSGSRKDRELPLFHLATVAASTNNFSQANVLGEGAFGVVYKGQLPSGEKVAVKRLKQYALQGLNEFMNEVIIIARLQHPNLVKLLGCCIQGSERIIIYEYMTNKSLDSFIFDKQRSTMINWRSRWEVIMGIAAGLLYLHEDSGLNIIHRDLKAANILLDEEMLPKISDFGTARLFRREENEITTDIVVGTRGYMAFEYAMEGIFSVKSDVYSFGVLQLEIISGKRNSSNPNLLPSAWKLWEEGKAIDLRDEAIKTDITCDQSELERGVQVGLLCVQVCPSDRPTMSDVVQMLKGSKKIPKPSKPMVCTRITSE